MDLSIFEPGAFIRPDPRVVCPYLAACMDPSIIDRAFTGSVAVRSRDRERSVVRALAPLEGVLEKLAKDGIWRPGKGPSPFVEPLRALGAVLAEVGSSHRTLNPADVGAAINGINAIATKIADRRRLVEAINEAVKGGVTRREEAEARAELEPVVGSLAAALLCRHQPEAAQRVLALVRAGDAACRSELGAVASTTEELFATMLERRGDAAARVAEVLATDMSDDGIVDRLVGRRVQERIDAARRAELETIGAAVRTELGL